MNCFVQRPLEPVHVERKENSLGDGRRDVGLDGVVFVIMIQPIVGVINKSVHNDSPKLKCKQGLYTNISTSIGLGYIHIHTVSVDVYDKYIIHTNTKFCE